jgi:hypothetical protein
VRLQASPFPDELALSRAPRFGEHIFEPPRLFIVPSLRLPFFTRMTFPRFITRMLVRALLSSRAKAPDCEREQPDI